MTTSLMVVNVAAWAVVLIYSVPAVFSLLSRRQKYWGDPARLLTFAYSFLLIAFTMRRLVFAGDDTGINILFALSIGVAVFTFVLMRSYGRGRPIN